MERGFKYLEDKYGIDGAREIFEKICVNLVQCKFPDAHPVKPNPGDGGLDILIGDLPTPEIVCQCKFFINEIDDSQRDQIRKSFNAAEKTCKMKKWILYIPTVMTLTELQWWSNWKSRKHSQTGIKIEYRDGWYLLGKLKKNGMYPKIFDDDIRGKLNELHSLLEEQHQKVFNEVIFGESDYISSGKDYDNCTFVKMLESAKIMDTLDCKKDFFNAEIAEQCLVSKGGENNLAIYKRLKEKLRSIWKTQYKLHANFEDGNNLLAYTYERIEDLDETTLKSIDEINLLAKKGMLHQLADDQRLGWVKNYIEKLANYLRGSSDGKNNK